MKVHAIALAYFLFVSPWGLASQWGITKYEITDIACAEAHGIGVYVLMNGNTNGHASIMVPDMVEKEPLVGVTFSIEHDGQFLYTGLKEERSDMLAFGVDASYDYLMKGRFVASYHSYFFDVHLKPIYQSILDRGYGSDFNINLKSDTAAIEALEGCAEHHN